jgi:DNA-binding NarL/FixJ family response regulator
LTLDQLSERQLKVLVAIGKGMTNREIGVLLNLSESSIKQESSRIFKVLGAKSRYQAVKLARQQGVI